MAHWYVDIVPATGQNADRGRRFPDFAATLAFVRTSRTRASGDRLTVRAPAAAAPGELMELREGGAALG